MVGCSSDYSPTERCDDTPRRTRRPSRGQRQHVGNATAIVLRTISLFAVVTQLDVRASGAADTGFRPPSPCAADPGSDAFRSAAGYVPRPVREMDATAGQAGRIKWRAVIHGDGTAIEHSVSDWDRCFHHRQDRMTAGGLRRSLKTDRDRFFHSQRHWKPVHNLRPLLKRALPLYDVWSSQVSAVDRSGSMVSGALGKISRLSPTCFSLCRFALFLLSLSPLWCLSLGALGSCPSRLPLYPPLAVACGLSAILEYASADVLYLLLPKTKRSQHSQECKDPRRPFDLWPLTSKSMGF